MFPMGFPPVPPPGAPPRVQPHVPGPTPPQQPTTQGATSTTQPSAAPNPVSGTSNPHNKYSLRFSFRHKYNYLTVFFVGPRCWFFTPIYPTVPHVSTSDVW